jgi:hypothetical protein
MQLTSTSCAFQQCLIQENFNGVDWNICDFYKIHSSVMDGTFQQQLPNNLSIPDSTASSSTKRNRATDSDSEEPTPKKAKRQPQVRVKEGKGMQVHNADQSSVLKLKSNESYSKLGMKPQQFKYFLKQPNSTSSICANFHILGHCHANCQQKDSHNKLPTELQRAAEAWIKKCRNELREKQAHN